MRKLFFTLLLILSAIQFTHAQEVDFGIKGGINYNSDSFNVEALEAIKEDISGGNTTSKTGFHGGLWLRIKLPMVGFYIRPELVYTALKSEASSAGVILADYSFQKVDVPILFGKKFLKVAHIFVGPSFQYVVDGDLHFKDIKEINSESIETKVDGLTVGLQVGAGVELGNIGLDVRWERGFSDIESSFLGNQSDGTAFEDVDFDTRVNQFIVSLSIKF